MAWEEVIGLRNRTCKTFADDLNPLKCLLHSQVGISKHYLDAVGAWQDVDDTAEEPDTDGFTAKFTKLSYFGRIDNEGRRRFYPDRNDLSYWIEFKKPFPSMGIPTRSNRWFYWDFAHAVIGVRFDVDSLKFGFRLKDNQAPHSITIPFETQGITRQGRFLLHDGEVVAELRKPIATGSNLDEEGDPVQKDCDVVFGPGEVTISLDPIGLEYPIEIDPTINKQVGASSDDAFEYGAGTMNLVSTYLALISSGRWGGMRWTGVSVPGGATIDVAYIEIYVHDATDDFFTGKTLYGENANNPGTFTVVAFNISGRTDTTNSVALGVGKQGQGWKQLPSAVAIIQEIVDDQGGTGNALVLWIYSSTGDDLEVRTWDYTGNLHGAKLHIEYTAAAAGVPTHMDNYMRRRVVQG